ncbi:MAG: QueT transporter family protein [Lachnospiraceae bacterium]|nr:QueT transporter family protein [Lachnospiraceae bacterium]
MKRKWKQLATAGMIAALYTVLVWVGQPLASGIIQLRFAEALTVLPIFTPAGIPGVALGCFLANLLLGSVPFDIVFGTLATLIGAAGTYLLRKQPAAAFLPPILSNAVIIPFVLRYGYGMEGSLWYFALTVGIGEILSVGLFGGALYLWLRSHREIFDRE